MNGHLFISYSRVDGAEFAALLADHLVAGPPSYPVWLDRRDVRPGDDWDEQIVEAIRSCRGLLFVMTADSVRSGSVSKDEWSRALKYKKPVIPLRLDAEAELPFRLSSRQYIDFSDDFAVGVARLREYLAWTSTPGGVLAELRTRRADAERELPRADPAQRPRIEQDIQELGKRIADQQQLMPKLEAGTRRTEDQITVELEHEQLKRPVADLSVMSGEDRAAEAGARPRWRWDVALSFAGAQRDYVEQVARALQALGVSCFYDADEQIELWGKSFAEEQAELVVIFVSAEYVARDWTRPERRAALGRAIRDRRDDVLPARFDDTSLPGLLSDMVTVDLRSRTPQQFAAMIADKLTVLRGPVQQPKVFLCYRREDTQGFARGVYQSLAVKYGHEQVFRDIDSTPAGIRYSTWIESRVGQCNVMVVLIGDTWLSTSDRGGQRRLDLPRDWVRQEIETALRRDIPIIPVRVQGAPMPSEEELPPSIADLAGFQSAEVTDSRWDFDMDLLIRAIDNLITSDA
jgi:TIR domain